MTTKTLNLPAAGEGRHPRSRGTGVLAIVVATFGAVLLFAGVALAIAQLSTDKSDGYYTKDADLSSDGYALATDEVALDGDFADVPTALVGDVRIRAEDTAGDSPIFIGIARDDDVDRYLRRVEVTRVSDFGDDGEPKYEQVAGGRPATAPARQDFWLEQSQGRGQRQLVWDAKPGRWSVVAMNSDASPGLAINADIGAKFGWLKWVELGLVVFGLVIFFGGVAIWRRRPAAP